MKCLLFFLSFILVQASAQSGESTSSFLQLKLQSTEGHYGAYVAWNPEKQLYYTAMNGSSEFALEVFDSSGNHLHKTKCGVDLRGLWYHAKKQRLEAQAYDGRIYSWWLDEKGYPFEKPNSSEQKVQTTDPQATVLYSGKFYYWYSKGKIYYIGLKGLKALSISLPFDETQQAGLNQYSIGLWGGKKPGFVLFSAKLQTVYLLDNKGQLLHEHKLKLDFTPGISFNFAVCNQRVWLYHMQARSWYGYRLI